MNVLKTVKLDNGHSVELGYATWDGTCEAARFRPEGKFSPRSASELSLDDLFRMVQVVIQNNKFEKEKLADLITDAGTSLKFQCSNQDDVTSKVA